jgi:NAD(P)-dependent dehydrogenase (short-subunit alcohol dehydrogenase family)
MVDDSRPLLGKTMLVTGSTDGIGRQAALELADLGARVLVHGRTAGRVESVVAAIRRLDAPAEGFVADLSSLRQVRRLANEVLEAAPHLHVLVNNAGTYVHDRQLTEDGFETTLAVNHLAAFLLTNLLLPRLKQSAPARIINVSSAAHRSGYLEWDNLNGEQAYDGYSAYALTKLCNVLFTYELADRLRGSGVTVNCLHPGVVGTKLLEAGFPGLGGTSVPEGARTSVHLAASPKVADVTGAYFVGRRPERSSGASYDAAGRRRLWELTRTMVGLAPEETA